MTEFSCVIFDLDGTLVDTKSLHYSALKESLASFGFFLSADFHSSQLEGLPTMEKLNILSSYDPAISINQREILQLKQKKTLELIKDQIPYKKEIALLLSSISIKKNIKIGLCSNATRENVDKTLEAMGVEDYFDIVLSASEVKKSKPNPEIYLEAMNRLQAKPENTIVFEDSLVGVTAAKLAGCFVVQINSPEDLTLELLQKYGLLDE